MLNVALTFDYELFFGENFGSADEILFYPTEKLLNTLDHYNIKATFFADVLSVYMHEKYGLTDYCEKFSLQIKDMIARGHDVQLHIHSNWLKSIYKNETWKFDIESYRIHTFGFDENDKMSVPNIIKWGKEYLEKTAREIDENYCCVAYRAGGYSIQPHGQLFKCLLNNNIYVDSSIAIGQKASGINEYDFSGFPKKNGWWVDVDRDLEKPANSIKNAVYEIPIYYYRNSLIRRLFSPNSERRLQLQEMRGTFIGTENNNQLKTKKQSKIQLLFKYGKIKTLLSVDSLPYQAVSRAVNICTKKNGSISIIGHPKLIDAVWLKNFEKVLEVLSNKKNVNLTTMQEISRELELGRLND